MSTRGITLVPGTIVVLELDGTLCYVEDVQPTGARVVALPEQLPERRDTVIFTPGRVGAKVISPYSSAARVIAVPDLSERNREFIGTYEKLRAQHGPNYVQRTPEEEAAMSVTKAKATTERVHKAGRGAKKSPEERQQRRQQRKAAKVPCVKCGMVPIHANHHGGGCEYEAPAKKGRAAREPKASKSSSTGGTFRLVNPDISKLQADNEKFAQGNRFFRVFVALKGLPESTGTLAQVMGALMADTGKPVANPEKVTKRALAGLVSAGNVATD